MCEFAYENGKAERLNGIIKNNYLKFYEINTFEQLHKNVDRAVALYNIQRPHKSLRYQTPVAYENKIVLLQQQTTPKMTGSLDAKPVLNGASSPLQNEQTTPPTPGVLSAITRSKEVITGQSFLGITYTGSPPYLLLSNSLCTPNILATCPLNLPSSTLSLVSCILNFATISFFID